MADVTLIALIVVPAILTFLLKSNAALSFLALGAGFVSLSFAGQDLQNLTGQLNFSINSGTLNLLLVAVPLLLTLLVTRRSYSGNGKKLLHVLIALAAGGLLALVSVPLLSDSVRSNFSNSNLWSNLQKAQASIVGAGVFLSLMTVWFDKLKRGPAKKHK